MIKFKSGAKSSEIKPRYDLVPIEAIRRIAERLGKGAAFHGEHNYRKGVDDEEFIVERRNHAVEHLLNYVSGTTTKDKRGDIDTPMDHLSAALANLAMLAYLEEERIRRSSLTDEDSSSSSAVA